MKITPKYYLHIPTEIVRGEYCKLDSKTFVVYAFLLYKEFKQLKKGNTTKIDHVAMKSTIRIIDNRTLKKCFVQLHEVGLIKELIEKFPSNGYLTITLQKPFESKRFTRLPISLFNRLSEIGHSGFRLLFYYESYIKRQVDAKTFSHPSYAVIRADTLISNDSIMKYNNSLSDLHLLKVTKHKVETSVDLDKDRFIRWNNHYHVLLHNF